MSRKNLRETGTTIDTDPENYVGPKKVDPKTGEIAPGPDGLPQLNDPSMHVDKIKDTTQDPGDKVMREWQDFIPRRDGGWDHIFDVKPEEAQSARPNAVRRDMLLSNTYLSFVAQGLAEDLGVTPSMLAENEGSVPPSGDTPIEPAPTTAEPAPSAVTQSQSPSDSPSSIPEEISEAMAEAFAWDPELQAIMKSAAPKLAPPTASGGAGPARAAATAAAGGFLVRKPGGGFVAPKMAGGHAEGPEGAAKFSTFDAAIGHASSLGPGHTVHHSDDVARPMYRVMSPREEAERRRRRFINDARLAAGLPRLHEEDPDVPGATAPAPAIPGTLQLGPAQRVEGAFEDGQRAGHADKLLGTRNDYGANSSAGEAGYPSDYSRGYRHGQTAEDPENGGHGFYIQRVGSTQSSSFHRTRAEAERQAAHNNQYGGGVHQVMPADDMSKRGGGPVRSPAADFLRKAAAAVRTMEPDDDTMGYKGYTPKHEATIEMVAEGILADGTILRIELLRVDEGYCQALAECIDPLSEASFRDFMHRTPQTATTTGQYSPGVDFYMSTHVGDQPGDQPGRRILNRVQTHLNPIGFQRKIRDIAQNHFPGVGFTVSKGQGAYMTDEPVTDPSFSKISISPDRIKSDPWGGIARVQKEEPSRIIRVFGAPAEHHKGFAQSLMDKFNQEAVVWHDLGTNQVHHITRVRGDVPKDIEGPDLQTLPRHEAAAISLGNRLADRMLLGVTDLRDRKPSSTRTTAFSDHVGNKRVW